MLDIAVIDYGMGNLHSVSKAIEHVAPGMTVKVTSSSDDIGAACRVVFPGQGAMPDCMRELDARGLRQAVLKASTSKPFLGICIGLQMLFERSDEGNVTGLGVFRGQVRRFSRENATDASGARLKIPHMGWNRVRRAKPHPIWDGVADESRFYFVHSYYVVAPESDLVAATSEYPTPFVCAIARDNIFAVQFHPEKSADAGLRLLHNFVRWQPTAYARNTDSRTLRIGAG